MYNKVIRPFVLKHQKKIDETLGKAAGAAKTALNEGRCRLHAFFQSFGRWLLCDEETHSYLYMRVWSVMQFYHHDMPVAER